MRIKLLLVPESRKPWLPLNNYPFAATIYKLIANVDPEYASFLHEEGFTLNKANVVEGLDYGVGSKTKFKPFVFSRPQVYKPQIDDKRIYINESGVIKWQISSPIDRIIQAICTSLKTEARITFFDGYGSNSFKVESVVPVAPPTFTNKMRFLAISPITVWITKLDESGKLKKSVVKAHEDQIAPIIIKNLEDKFFVLTNKKLCDPNFSFEFDWDYAFERFEKNLKNHQASIKRLPRDGLKQLVAEQMSKLIYYKDMPIKSYLIPFRVRGEKDLIKVAWDWGLGHANSQGFGMIEGA